LIRGICSRCLGCPITCTSSKTIVGLFHPVGEIAIAIRGITAMTWIVLPFTCALGCTLRRPVIPVQIISLIAPIASVAVGVASIVAPVLGVIRVVAVVGPIVILIVLVVVVLVIDFGVAVAPVVIAPVVTGRGAGRRARSVGQIRVTIIRTARIA
jgi:hypothetical protein